jgi:hypothetical protein
MTTDVFQKLITLSCGLDMVSDTERQDMVHQISDMVIQSVALRASTNSFTGSDRATVSPNTYYYRN